ncbi:MAG TPA: insulinase family protein [Pyrinomonadaceae bacterium]|jgi:zinc protease
MMRRKIAPPVNLRTLLACALLLALPTASAPARPRALQTGAPEPRREQLLNGLPILLTYRPGDPQVLLKLRVQSGAAFDLAGKEGLMTLLSDILFPDPNTREFVAEELGGRLEVATDYDHIDVTLAGRAAEFERLAELLRNAVVNTRIVAEDLARLRAERSKAASAAALAPAAVADRVVAARLYGAHPYGRLVAGTPESLAHIERADLLLARDRFLTADNARLVVIGGVEPARALRVFRQFLGAWRKSETLVPATFRRPDAPNARTLVVDQAGADSAEVRLAVRGLARTERDQLAAEVLAALARNRWQTALGSVQPDNLSVRHEAHALAGLWQMSARVRPANVAQTLEAARTTLNALVTTPPTTAELEQARRAAAAIVNPDKQPDVALADRWLDAESYGPTNEQRSLDELTPADIQRVAARLFRDASVASVAVGPLSELRAQLARTASGVEVFGAPAPAMPSPSPARRP